MEEKISFNSGDVVRLKSGGPKMTVEHVNNDGNAGCTWFPKYADGTYSSHPQIAYFAPEVLELITVEGAS